MEPEKPNPQDDTRFFRSENEEEKKEGPEEKKIPIELPEIELPVKKEPPKESPKEPPIREEEPKEIKEEPPSKPEIEIRDIPKEIIKEEEPKKKKVNLKNPFEKLWQTGNKEGFQLPEFFVAIPHKLLLIYIFIALFAISFFVYIFFASNIARLKNRMGSEAKLAEDMVIGKERVAKEKASLAEEVDILKTELASIKGITETLKKQNESLKKTISAGKAEYLELEETLRVYAEELRELTVKRMGYYDGYKKEKANTKQLSSTIGQLEGKIDDLRTEMGSIYGRYKDKEAEYIYNMALLYVEAGMFDEAIESFKNFLELNKEDAGAYYNLAFIYEHAKKDRKKAVKYYKRYLKLNPNAEDLYEIKMKIGSLERGNRRTRTGLKGFKIKLNDLKF